MMKWTLAQRSLPKSLVESFLGVEEDFSMPELLLKDIGPFFLMHNANHLHTLYAMEKGNDA
jgi:hypothetical protein